MRRVKVGVSVISKMLPSKIPTKNSSSSSCFESTCCNGPGKRLDSGATHNNTGCCQMSAKCFSTTPTAAQHVNLTSSRNDSEDNYSEGFHEEGERMKAATEEHGVDIKVACNCRRSPREVYHSVHNQPTLINLPNTQTKQEQQERTLYSENQSLNKQMNYDEVLKQQQQPSLSQNSNARHIHTCKNYYVENNLPYPQPLPEPKYSFYRRVLPQSLIQLSSPSGKKLFQESLLSGSAESFFPLSEQFLNQSDPAYCGVTSLIMILNAIGIDPNIRWKGGWRWYGSEDMVLGGCCIDKERVKRAGISMEEFQSLGRCQGLKVYLKRPGNGSTYCQQDEDEGDEQEGKKGESTSAREEEGDDDGLFYTIDEFRKDIKIMVQNPPIYEIDTDDVENNDTSISDDAIGGFLVVSFSRKILGQTGDGHFSPVAAYHESTDRCLILDVARFKYSPYWVSVTDLYEAMKPLDPTTKKSRGWFMNHPPDLQSNWNINNKQEENDISSTNNKSTSVLKSLGYSGSKATDEVKRPASEVPLFDDDGENSVACPVGKIKMEYCSVAK